MTTLDALAFGYHGHGIPCTTYPNQLVLVLDLTSTQQASMIFLF